MTRMRMALIVLALVLSACGGQAATAPSDAQLTVTMKEYSVTLSVPTVKAGSVKIAVKNDGGMAHDFDLIKTDVAFDKLPVDSDGKAKMDGLVKQVQNVAVGKLTTVTADLGPGSYVIICNLPGHYSLGMRIGLKVG